MAYKCAQTTFQGEWNTEVYNRVRRHVCRYTEKRVPRFLIYEGLAKVIIWFIAHCQWQGATTPFFINALLFNTWVFEDCLRGIFSSCCPISWIVIPQYCQHVTRKPSSCFYNKNLLRVTREKHLCYNSLKSFTKSFTSSTNHASLTWYTAGMPKIIWVDASSISLYEDTLFEIVFKM